MKNTGTIDANVRVKIEKAWRDNSDNDGKLNDNTGLSTDNILINFNTVDWYYNDADGYYYYKGVLVPGEVTTPLIDSFVVDGSTTGSDYAGKTADIVVSMNMIQAGANGISYWGVSLKELGINYQSSVDETVTKIEFINFSGDSNSNFAFEANEGDLFSNFKSMVPGENRSQIIEVTNTRDYLVEIFLNAEYTDQEYASPETLELVNKLLKEYATMVITDEDGNVIYSGAVWGNLDKNTTDETSMKYMKSLGVFKGKETKKLCVSLFLDPQMDNKYQDLLAKVKWVVSAAKSDAVPPETTSPPENIQETTEPDMTQPAITTDDATSTTENINPSTTPSPQIVQSDITTDSVKTGSEVRLYVYIIIMLVSAAFIVFLIFLKKE